MESESDDSLRNESHLDHSSLPPLIEGACGYAVPGNHQLNSMLTESGSMREKKKVISTSVMGWQCLAR
jgi:hypothetical protein